MPIRLILAAALALLALAAPASAQSILHRGNGAEPDTLDPDKSQGIWEAHIIGDVLLGLYTEDINGDPMYGAAESDTVSPDGLVWTFKLRAHTWSDGTPVTPQDFIAGWQRLLDPKTGGQYAALLYGFKNAKAINEGRMTPDQLGARAIDDKTLELTLENPAPYLPQLLMHQTAFPVPKHVLDKVGNDWVKPGNYLANGPYVLAEWRPNDVVRLVKNDKFYDAASVKIDEVDYYPTSDTSAALKRLRAGEIDMQDGLSSADIEWIKQNLPGGLFLNPALAVTYFAVNSSKPPMNDKRIREALSLAFDRDTIANKVLKFEEPAAYGLVPPGTAGFAGGNALYFKDMPYDQRVAKAKELMAAAGYSEANPLTITVDIGPAPDNKRVGAMLQQMWRPIYVDAQPRSSESHILYAALRSGDFTVAQATWGADYNDAANFLYLFRTDSKDMNYGRFSNAEFDRLMFESEKTADLDARAKLLGQAEKIVIDEMAFIPARFVNVRHAVAPYVKGFVANIRDINRTRWMSIDKPGAATTSQ